LAFGYQIYCDFSGYTDMALGAAEVLGIRLRPNFRAPYHSASLQEFWTRWHMSLSTWFRDYVYIPLGGNRVSGGRWALNILVVFVLSGVWHGANWTFLIWGLYHGIVLIGERAAGHLSSAVSRSAVTASGRTKLFRIVRTFCLVTAGWVLFRASSLHVAGSIFYKIGADWGSFLTPERLLAELSRFKWKPIEIAVTLLAILMVELGDTFQSRVSVRDWLSRRPLAVRWAGYYSLLLFILFFGHFNGAPFIYFQF
ncbi:MAG TPA: MBOAT family O-acyltransferase, partial [Planctomycetaceae bacterium]|nr:MBOAT family O-acyltransferase [Planctomycetaceae bacterium]